MSVRWRYEWNGWIMWRNENLSFATCLHFERKRDDVIDQSSIFSSFYRITSSSGPFPYAVAEISVHRKSFRTNCTGTFCRRCREPIVCVASNRCCTNTLFRCIYRICVVFLLYGCVYVNWRRTLFEMICHKIDICTAFYSRGWADAISNLSYD